MLSSSTHIFGRALRQGARTLLCRAAFCGAVLFAWSCDDHLPTKSAGGAGVIIPLSVGNTWIGTTTTYDSIGAVLSTVPDTVKIVAAESSGVSVWYRTNKDALLQNRSDGCWIKLSELGLNLTFLTAKYPAAVDDIFRVDTLPRIGSNGSLSGVVAQYSTVISTRRTVFVPKGRFICAQYRDMTRPLSGPGSAGYDLYYDQYYAPNIGYVKGEYFARTTEGRLYVSRRWELVDYVLR